ncbi:MAG: RDD family protein [Lachnospiraceae bacterium]|nr:RDD family protein [Lachnospiraceae bacterium]
MFDAILVGVLAVGIGFLLSVLFGYDGYSQTVENAYSHYEAEYGITFDISQEAYETMSEQQRIDYETAYEALLKDEEAMYAYNMMLNLSLMITSLGIFVAILLWEFVFPLFFGNGQTLGKKIFGLCLMRVDGVKVNNVQLFARALLGRYAIEVMIPVAILLMLFWGTVGLFGTLFLLGLLIVQVVCMLVTRTNSAIHDLLAGTVVVDMASQMIFNSTEELIEFKKKVAAEQAMRQTY